MARKYQLVPSIETVVATTVNAAIGTAQSFVLNSQTRMIEVIAKNGALCIRDAAVGTAGLTSGSFALKVTDGGTRHYPINGQKTLSIIGENATVELTLIEYKEM